MEFQMAEETERPRNAKLQAWQGRIACSRVDLGQVKLGNLYVDDIYSSDL